MFLNSCDPFTTLQCFFSLTFILNFPLSRLFTSFGEVFIFLKKETAVSETFWRVTLVAVETVKININDKIRAKSLSKT